MKKILLRTSVSLLFIGFLFYLMREDVPQVLRVLKNADTKLIWIAAAVFFSTVFVLARRLQLVFAAEDISLRFSDAANLTFVGYFFNNFLPTSVGGDIVKAMSAARITGHPVKSVTCVLMDRIFGLFTFILIPSVSLLFALRFIGNPVVPVLVYSFLAVSLSCFFVLFNRSAARRVRFLTDFLQRFRLGEKLKMVYQGMHDFQRHKGVMILAMALSLVGQTVGIFALYMMATALGSHAPIFYFYLLVPVVQLLSMLPSLNGLGIREGAYIYFLTPYIGKEYAAAIGILSLGLLLLASLVGGIIYLVRHDYHVHYKRDALKSA